MESLWPLNTIADAEAFLDANGPLELRNYIDGGYTTTTGSFIDAYDPKTGKKFAEVPITLARDVQTAVDAASAAFVSWSRTARTVRSRMLQKIADLIQENRELFAVWESIDQGKTIERARVEVDRAVSNFSYFATFILHEQTAARMIDGSALTYEHRSPLGVCALISPWNMPLYLLTWKIAPCLAFGCTAVAKHSEITSVSAYILAEVFRRAGVPPGVINIVFGDGRTTGAELVKHPAIKGISFTGGTATGIKIREATVSQIYKHVSLELGGKNPTIVFDDVDMEKPVPLVARAAFENQGEICLCGSRVYVQSRIYEDFVAKFVDFVDKTYRQGEGLGAVVSLEHYRKIRSYLVLAEEEKAKFRLGTIPSEHPPSGYWIGPVVLTGVAQQSRIRQEEIFGPVVTITPFDSEDDAVRLANDNPNGLAATLLTKDGARMRRVGEQINAGLVWVNCWLVRELGTPFGGMKNSGTGREGGEYSRDVFTQVRTLHLANAA